LYGIPNMFFLDEKSYGVCVSDYVTLLLFRHRPPYVHLGRQSQILMSCKFQFFKGVFDVRCNFKMKEVGRCRAKGPENRKKITMSVSCSMIQEPVRTRKNKMMETILVEF
ncbi:hypothetical protein HID58_050650, partial [Brassica napus]